MMIFWVLGVGIIGMLTHDVGSRFLRARKFDVEAAWGQFRDTEDWRKENSIESLYENISVDSYDAARRMVGDIFLLCYCGTTRREFLLKAY